MRRREGEREEKKKKGEREGKREDVCARDYPGP